MNSAVREGSRTGGRITRRELVMFVGAAVMLLASFLDYAKPEHGDGLSSWHRSALPLLVGGYFTGAAAGVVTALARSNSIGRELGRTGLTARQLAGALVVVSAGTHSLTFVSRGQGYGEAASWGVWLGALALTTLVVGEFFAHRIPALADGSAGPRSPGASPGCQGRPAQSPFWFSVAAPVDVHDPATGAVRYELQPGTWYLAIADQGSWLEVRDDSLGDAVLHDPSLAQRADLTS